MTISHPVITDVGFRGDPAHASSVVKVLAGAGQATPPGRSIKRSLQLRYTAHAIRNRGVCGCRADTDMAKAAPAAKQSSRAVAGTTGVQATAWGKRTGRVNWGPSAAGGVDPQPDGIIHKPSDGRQRRGCGHSKRRSCGTAQPAGEPRATGRGTLSQRPGVPLGRKSDYGTKTHSEEIETVVAYKRVLQVSKRGPLIPLPKTRADFGVARTRAASLVNSTTGEKCACLQRLFFHLCLPV